MDAPVPLILAAVLAAATLVVPSPRLRAWAMLGALAIAPVILISHVSGTEQFGALTDRPALAAAAAAAALVAVGVLAWVMARRPALLPVLAVAALPFRVPIAVAGTTVNLLIPLYAVVAAGVLAYALPRLGDDEDRLPERRPGLLEWALAATLALYAVQAIGSSDYDRALENVVFFYVPFALLFALVSRVEWSRRLTVACLGTLVVLALAFAGIGFYEYATRHLLLNPKVIASNQLEETFRVNSLFFDPNIYGRFLTVVMLLVAAWLLWARRWTAVAVAVAVLGVLWGGLLLTLSQSSFTALLAGLAVLGAQRWSPRRVLALAAVALAAAAAFVALAPGALRLDLGSAKSANDATSGRYDLVRGGVELFEERPLEGWGSGAFAREYRRAEDVSAERAASASHTIPVTVAAEQGVGGLMVYLAVLACALWRLFRGVAGDPARAAIAAAFAALVVHTMLYAAFLEDPMTWTLLAVGTALAVAARQEAPAAREVEHEQREPAPAPA